MKRVFLILFAFVTGTMFAQEGGASASASARINAEIVSPIIASSEGMIDFGRIAATNAGGVVTIAPDGTRSADDENMLIPGEGSTAVFLVKAADGYAYNLNVSADPLTNGTGTGAHTMDVEFTLAQDKLTGNGQDQEIGITSTLTVNPAQAAGEYTGEVILTVSYE